MIKIEESHSQQIDCWIAERHYLGYSPPGARLRLWFFKDDVVIGAMMWGRPSARLLDQERILELTRMFFVDGVDFDNLESYSLGRARKFIRQRFPQIKLLLAYSDLGQNHQGIVYEADNWCPFGIAPVDTWTRKDRPRRETLSKKQRWIRSP